MLGVQRIKTSSLLCTLLSLLMMASIVACLKPTAPVMASPNTESSPSNFIFSFSLSKELPLDGYLMVVFPFYPSTITPSSCTLLNTLSATATVCQNLNLASSAVPNPLTINSTRVNTINANIPSTLTIVVGFSVLLTTSTSHSVQIKLQDNLPSVGALSQSF